MRSSIRLHAPDAPLSCRAKIVELQRETRNKDVIQVLIICFEYSRRGCVLGE